MLDLLHRGADPDTGALHRACWNYPLSAELLIKWGASVSEPDGGTGGTALHFACGGRSMDCVRLLLSHNSPTGEPGCVYVAVSSI